MPYSRPTLPTIIQQVQSDVASRLAGSNPWLPFSDLQILSYVFAGLQYGQYQYLDWIARQAIPVTATDESLAAWAALKGLSLIAATSASGTATFTGTPGTLVPDLTICVRPDGFLYQVPTGFGGTIPGGGTLTTTLTATTPGLASNLTLGTPAQTFTLQTPISGLLATVTVASSFTGGADVETQDSLRARLIERFSAPVQGGSLADYRIWARAFGATRAWSAGPTVMGEGTATVWFCLDDSSHTNGIPLGAGGVSQYETRAAPATLDALHLADYLYPLRPATALVYVIPPTATPLNITLAEVPSDVAIRSGISTAVKNFLLRRASPGGVVLPDLSPGGILRVSQLEDAISSVAGLDFFVLQSPSADVVVGTGQLSTPGTITYL